jgi:hypothetical protein
MDQANKKQMSNTASIEGFDDAHILRLIASIKRSNPHTSTIVYQRPQK